MAEYGWLTEIRVVARTTTLTVAAAISDTELVVDSAGDLKGADAGESNGTERTLEINGTQMEYTDITWGVTEDDTDTIILADPLTIAGDEGDEVASVSGGLAEEDWYGIVDMGGGDPVHVPVGWNQRQSWAPGIYDPPVLVAISEDLMHLEDAPGRPVSASGRTQFLNTDTVTAEGPGELPIHLTRTPIAGSEHVLWNGLWQPATEWTRVGNLLTLTDAEELVRVDDVLTVAYAYDSAAVVTPAPEPEPGVPGVAFESSGWKWLQVGRTDPTDYSASAFNDSGWASVAAPFGASTPPGYIETIRPWPTIITAWDQNTRMWARRTVAATAGVDMFVKVRLNRYVVVYLNGIEVADGQQATTEITYTVDGSDVLSSNVLAIQVTDDNNSGIHTGCYFDVEVSQ